MKKLNFISKLWPSFTEQLALPDVLCSAKPYVVEIYFDLIIDVQDKYISCSLGYNTLFAIIRK